MNTSGEIRTAVNAFFNDTVFTSLKSRWHEDFNLWRLKPYDAGSGYFSYTTNAPRNLVNKAIGMLTEAKLIIRVPEEGLDDKSRTIANNVERFCYGVLNFNDSRLSKIPYQPSLRGNMAWQAALRGGFAIRCYVYKDKKTGQTIPDFAILDRYNTAFGFDDYGVTWAAHQKLVSKEHAKSAYGKESGDDVTVIDFWDRENNIVIAGEEIVKQEAHGLDYCPIFIFTAGDMPQVFQEQPTNLDQYIGEGVLATNRNIYPIINKLMSDWCTIVRRGVKVPLGIWSSGGEKTIDRDVWQTEKGSAVQLDLNDKVAPLFEQSMPADANNLFALVSGDEQLGGISHVAQGQLGFRLSGFAISQLQSSLSTVISPFAQTIERALLTGMMCLIEQYANGDWKPLSIRGRTSKDVPFGFPKAVDLSPDDIKGDWMPEVRLVPVLPKDDAQKYEMAFRATQGQRPLLSIQTAQDALLEIPDTLSEGERISREWAQALPTMRLYDAVEAELQAGRIDKAMNLINELRKFNSMNSGGGGTQAALPGFSTETLPSEAEGGVPPGAANAVMPPPEGA